MGVEAIINRLDFCKPSGKDKWMARCPAHDDRGPSLRITDAGGGRTLIHCFAGCGAIDVLAAIGLEMTDLYPPTDRNYSADRRQHEKSVDELVLEIAEADRQAGKDLSADDLEREAEAFARQILNEPSPDPDDAKELFSTYAYRQQKGIKKVKKAVAIPEELLNQTTDEWLADYVSGGDSSGLV